MTEETAKTKETMTINGAQHIVEDMTPEQQTMVNHIADLDKKLNSTKFNADQLQVGKDAFVNMLKTSLTSKEEKEVQQ